MFDMEKIGETIALKRREKNMTQGQFAQKLSITHQAVSKWERGEAMPEISKLIEIANILDISLDEILTAQSTSSSIESELIDEDINPQNNKNNFENQDNQNFQNSSDFDNQYYENKDIITFADFYEIAPKLSQNALLDGIRKFKISYGMFGVRNLFKFTQPETADKIALESFGLTQLNDFKLIFKYLSDEMLNSIVARIYKTAGINGIVEAVPYLKPNVIEKMAFESYSLNGISSIIPIAKYLPPKMLEEMAETEVENIGSWQTIDRLIPLLPSENVYNLAYKFYKNNELSSFNGRWDLIGRENTAKLVSDYVAKNKYIKDCWFWCEYILPFCQQDILEKAILKGYEINGFDSIQTPFRFLSDKTKAKLLKENNIKSSNFNKSKKNKKVNTKILIDNFRRNILNDLGINIDTNVDADFDMNFDFEDALSNNFENYDEEDIEHVENIKEEIESTAEELEDLKDEIEQSKDTIEGLIKSIKIQKDNLAGLKDKNASKEEKTNVIDEILSLQDELREEKEQFENLLKDYSSIKNDLSQLN